MLCSPCCSLSPLKDVEGIATCPRQGTERSNRYFGEQLYGKLDFHTWERKPRALPGFIIGFGVPLDGETSLQPQHFTRSPWSERNHPVNSVTWGWQDTPTQSRPGGSSSESPSQQEFWGPGEVWVPLGSSGGWVGDVEPVLVLGNVPPALLPAESCFPGLCLSPETKPGDPYPTGTHSLPRELSFAPLSQQHPEHSILWAFHSCLSRARDQRPVWGCYSEPSSTTPILIPPLSLWLLSWLCLQGNISCFLIYYLFLQLEPPLLCN